MELSDAVIQAIWKGNKIAAIKLLREEKSLGLREAKEAVDAYINNDSSLKQKFQAQSAKSQRGCLMWIVVLAGLGFWIYSYVANK